MNFFKICVLIKSEEMLDEIYGLLIKYGQTIDSLSFDNPLDENEKYNYVKCVDGVWIISAQTNYKEVTFDEFVKKLNTTYKI